MRLFNQMRCSLFSRRLRHLQRRRGSFFDFIRLLSTSPSHLLLSISSYLPLDFVDTHDCIPQITKQYISLIFMISTVGGTIFRGTSVGYVLCRAELDLLWE